MKKTFKVILSAVLALTMLLSVMSAYFVSAAEAAPLSDFTIQAAASADSNKALGSVKWWYSEVDGKYYMFMPSSADLSSVVVWFDAVGDVYCGDTKLESGQATDIFADGGEYTLIAGSTEYQIVFVCTSDMPSIFINTESGNLDYVHKDKENKEPGDMLALDENGKIVYNKALTSIKGRGNSTWNRPKKPYNIKLDKSTDLFGLGKAKNWCLLANYDDHTLIRNQIVYNMGKSIGMTESPDCIGIDLYINNEYMGAYLLTEKVEIKENRVEIFDLEAATEDCNENALDTYPMNGYAYAFSGYLENTQRWYDIPNNPEDITGGYLLELEISKRYDNEPSGFVANSGQKVVVKSPEYASEAQIKYISNYWQEMEDALYSEDGYNSLGKHYSEYIDLTSYANQYLIQEWTGNWDAGLTSNFFYKDINGKIIAGPVWDFDTSLKNYDGRDGYNLKDPTTWHAKVRTLYGNSIFGGDLSGGDVLKSSPNIYALGFKHADFVDKVWDQWTGEFYDAANELIDTKLDGYVRQTIGAAIMNAIRWNYYSTTDFDTIASEYMNEVDYMRGYIVERTAFLNDNLGLHNEPIVIEGITSQKYTGSAIEPEVKVSCLDLKLVENVDYTVRYENNVEKGVATVIVTGIGDYEGRTAQTTFKIIAIDDPLNCTGGSCEERAKENLTKIGDSFVDNLEIALYYLTKPLLALIDKLGL